MSDIAQSSPIAVEEATPSRKFSPISITGLVAMLLILAMLGWGLLNSTATRPEAGVIAPNFNLQFFNGYEWENRPTSSLGEMRGKVIVLNFWASWCVECRLEADLLEEIWKRYADKDVVFLGIAYVDAEPQSLAYMQEFNITYPNAPDLRGAISNDYKITGVPETFYIDKKGVIRQVTIGPENEARLTGIIEQLLAE